MGLINFQGITKTYAQRLLLDGISFSVERGERLALIGPNGAGKTTLVRIAMGQETADAGQAFLARGTQAGFLMQDLSTLGDDENALHWGEIVQLEDKLRAMEARMAAASAEEMDALLKDYARLTARYEAMDGYTVESRLKATLLGLGLRKEALGTPLMMLSSGERMRVALARILLKSPDLLVLDEPTNHLDIAATMWLEEYLSAFPGGVLIISHDRYFLDRVATRVIELKNATTIEHHGNYSSFLQQQQIRTEFLHDEKERLDREIRLASDLARRLRATAHITQAQSREKGIERMKAERQRVLTAQREGHLGRVNATQLNLQRTAHVSAEIAAAEHATKRYGERVLFRDANFLIRGGEHVAIVGENGCGKTTLLRILLGQDPQVEGVCRIGPWVKVGLLDQNAEFDDAGRTMLEEVIFQKEQAPGIAGEITPQQERPARDLLGKVGFYGDEIHKAIAKLSGGERVRLKLALLLQQEPQCLVLDEPTNHLDLPAREAVENAVATFRGTVIAVSHDRYFLNRCATRILAFEGEKIVAYDGNWDDYRAAIALQKEREAQARIAVQEKRRTQGSPAEKADNGAARAALEAEIERLEAHKQALEALMGPDADAQVYMDYQQAERALEELYAQWVEE